MVAVGDKDSHSLNSLEALCTDNNITAACTVSNRNDHPCIHNRRCTQDHNRNMVVECMVVVECTASNHNNANSNMAVVECMVVVECMANHNSLNLAVDLAACTASNHSVNNSHNMVAAGCMAVAWAAVCTVSRKCNNRSMAVVDSVVDSAAECTVSNHNNDIPPINLVLH